MAGERVNERGREGRGGTEGERERWRERVVIVLLVVKF